MEFGALVLRQSALDSCRSEGTDRSRVVGDPVWHGNRRYCQARGRQEKRECSGKYDASCEHAGVVGAMARRHEGKVGHGWTIRTVGAGQRYGRVQRFIWTGEIWICTACWLMLSRSPRSTEDGGGRDFCLAPPRSGGSGS